MDSAAVAFGWKETMNSVWLKKKKKKYCDRVKISAHKAAQKPAAGL